MISVEIAGVVDDVRLVVGRAERMQGDAPVAVQAAPAAHEDEDLGTVLRQHRRGGLRTGVQRLERLGVLARPRSEVGAGERDVARVQGRIVTVLVQGGRGRMAGVDRGGIRSSAT